MTANLFLLWMLFSDHWCLWSLHGAESSEMSHREIKHCLNLQHLSCSEVKGWHKCSYLQWTGEISCSAREARSFCSWECWAACLPSAWGPPGLMPALATAGEAGGFLHHFRDEGRLQLSLFLWHCQFSPLLKTDLVHFLTVDMLKNLSTVDVKQRGFFSQQGLSCYKSITWIIMGCEKEGHCLFLKILCFLTIYIMYFLIFACAMC